MKCIPRRPLFPLHPLSNTNSFSPFISQRTPPPPSFSSPPLTSYSSYSSISFTFRVIPGPFHPELFLCYYNSFLHYHPIHSISPRLYPALIQSYPLARFRPPPISHPRSSSPPALPWRSPVGFERVEGGR